jgi:hypothetical protein
MHFDLATIAGYLPTRIWSAAANCFFLKVEKCWRTLLGGSRKHANNFNDETVAELLHGRLRSRRMGEWRYKLHCLHPAVFHDW